MPVGPKNAYRNAQKPKIVSGLKFLEIYDKDDDSLLDHIVIGWTTLYVHGPHCNGGGDKMWVSYVNCDTNN